ncbi:hypothetical protein MNBD_GAMMA05-1129 [hydrothermal vent metagenome]|uniref:DUF2846 domain-containing protein n=1 Tax=hydrothermal vent metagenome TaxID=652676 RepID=A0A3B0WQ72_9ZZZZ
MLTLFACSTTNQNNIFVPVATNEKKAVVYIYRPTKMTNATYSPDLLVNKEVKLSLKTGNKYLLNLPLGDTNFEIEPEKNYSGITQVTLSLKPNKRYYLRIDTSLKINNSITYETYQRGFSLVEIEEKNAVAEIAECCSKKTTEREKAKSTPDKTDSGNSFSVDKTQNPFSH